ncbi:hypothetical protein F4859DRAFT_480631 [Xylaria cf. heliscus]|nr:hypothetical protein F4859DRAFT_480631 [Xylaria cf. heliscus]
MNTKLAFERRVVQELEHCGRSPAIAGELLDSGTVIKSRAGTIHHLRLPEPVIQPILLQQIHIEYNSREGLHYYVALWVTRPI